MNRQSLLLFGWLLLATPMQAQFNYTVTNGTVTITEYTGTSGVVAIPDTISGLPVTSIRENAFGFSGITSVTIPDSVTNLGGYAFFVCTNLTNVTIPNSVTSIGEDAFGKCTSLTQVTIPNSVTKIGVDAFWACTSLTAINAETNNPAYRSASGVLFDKNQTTLIEYPVVKFGSYSIPTTVTNIAEDAFYDCSGLTSVIILNSVTSIGDTAFVNCYGLTSVTIPNSVTSIGTAAFAGCFSLTNVTIPKSVTSIGDQAFIGTGLTSVSIPNNVTNIGSGTFFFCTNLAAISVETNNPSYSSVGGVLFNQSQTTLIVYPDGKARSYSIPNSVTSIGADAFAYCSSLTTVTLPNSVTSIGQLAFLDCTNLTNIIIPNSVTNIGFQAFEDCTGLTSVTIPSSVTSIGESAFYQCSGLTSVTIGNSVIGVAEFAGCTNLAMVHFQGNAPSYDSSVFSPDYHATIYYLPGTTGWDSWGSIITGLPTAQWILPYPLILDGSLGVLSNQFSFTVSWATNLNVVVEAATNLANPIWSPLATNALSGGTYYFADTQRANYPERFYRVRSQ